MRKRNMTLDELLDWAETQAVPVPNSGCLVWLGHTQDDYGVLWFNGRMEGIHRLSLSRKLGRPLGADHALHSCDVKCCFEPAHLAAGDHQENMRQRDARGLRKPAVGEGSGTSKLRDVDVHRIREDPRPNAQIAKDLGVTGSLVGMIKARKIWKHLD